MSYDFRLTRPVGSHGLHCLGEKKAISLCPHSRVESCGIIDDVKNKDLNTPFTSSTAQGGGGSFKNRKPIGELGCCESRMAERSHWWTDRWLRSRLFLSLSVSFSDYLPTYPPIYLCIHLSLSLCLSIYLTNLICLSNYVSIYLPIYLSTYLPACLPACLAGWLAVCLSLCLSLCLSVCLSIYLSICKLENEAILRDVLRFWTWQHQKRSNSAKLPQFLNLTTSKTKQFWETSSFFKVDSIKNEAIRWDFLNISTWQRQKRSNSARLLNFSKLATSKTKQFCETSFKNGKLRAALIFSNPFV